MTSYRREIGDFAMGLDYDPEYDAAYRDYDDDAYRSCDSCTCCTSAGCVPAECGEDDYGRFRCPCTSE